MKCNARHEEYLSRCLVSKPFSWSVVQSFNHVLNLLLRNGVEVHAFRKEHGRYVSKAVYTILGLNIEDNKELFGLYLSEQEGAHHWLSVLSDLHNRGVKDILIVCVDGLKGFPEAIESLYPQTEIQHCVIHQIRNSLKYVASKTRKPSWPISNASTRRQP